jgi:riboflavin biosynthesis pyrimidine reductase
VARAWEDAFSAFSDRKTREAIGAATPPYVTELDHSEAPLIAIGNAWSAARFDGRFYITPPAERGRPACSLVFVQSADGNTGARNPTALGGGETDKHVVYEGLSRVAADAVLAGARTVRGGQAFFSVWHPALIELRQSLGLPRHPAQIVATLTGLDLDTGLLFNVPALRVVLLTTPGCAAGMRGLLDERPWIRTVLMETPDRLDEAFAALRDLGISQISCIGGRTLAAPLVDRRLVDDVYITTSPRPGGEPGTPMLPRALEASLVVRKHGTAEETGVVFEQFHAGRSWQDVARRV